MRRVARGRGPPVLRRCTQPRGTDMRISLSVLALSACHADPRLGEAELAAKATSAVCHEGRTMHVAPSAVAAHVGHGDAAGACDTGWTPRVAIGNALGGDAFSPIPQVDSTVWSGPGLATG